jgi:hypothetical protein
VTQLVLPLHECAAEPLQDAFEAVADPTTTESAAEPLHSVADPAAASAALTETSYLLFEFESIANHII